MSIALCCSRFLLLVALLFAAALPVCAAPARGMPEKPAGLDDAGWASLQQAVRGTIDQQAKLTASQAMTVQYVGFSVVLDGNTALVGAPGDDVGGNDEQGSAFVFIRSGSGWSLQAKLLAADGAVNDQFGISVALDGDTALIGANHDDIGAIGDEGSAYVFVRSGSNWTQQAKLTAGDGMTGDYFGTSVAVDGDTALVGAYADLVGPNLVQGSAYVFTRSGSSWTQQVKLTAAGGAAQDRFGSSVALEGDTALIGASRDDVGANNDQGSAYVFTRSGTVWSQQAQLTAGDGALGDEFGISVALAGNTALVGAHLDDVGTFSGQGSAYVFTRSGTVWTQQARLTVADGVSADSFGISVALAGDTALVGAYFDEVGANINQGSAYVFTRSGTVWTEQAKLTSSDGEAGDFFGVSVALDGDTALVGAYFDDIGANNDQGSAYVFTRSGSAWSQQVKLTAADGAAEFGFSVALDGVTALVGAAAADIGVNSNQGSAYVFIRSGSTWIEQAQLTADDGAAGDSFGSAVALADGIALVGASGDDIGANAGQGSAYVFTRSGNTWTQQARLTAGDGAANDLFGVAVAVASDTALVGAPGGNSNQGSAYVFTRSGSTWIEQARLTAGDGAIGDEFGVAVALDGDTALLGAVGDDVGGNGNQGSAYVFTRSGSTWTQQAQLTAGDGAANDLFGVAVAVAGDTALVGSHLNEIGGNAQGSAYVFTRSGSTWTQQAQLTAGDGADADLFGISVALGDGIALVGAFGDDIGANTDQGSAYVFTRSGSTWTQLARLTAGDGAAGDAFGGSVALDGDTGLIGARFDDIGANSNQGSAYVFTGFGVQADLAITKTDGVTTVTPGGSTTYTITASNAGPSAAPGSTVTDSFPAGLTCAWTCIGAGGGTCTASGSGSINDTVNLPAGASVTYTAACDIAGSASGSLVNTATVAVAAGVTDPNTANNNATDTNTVAASADLAITKTDGVTTVTPGGSTTYTITASNAGPSAAPGSIVSDTFPAGLTCTWTCVGAGGGTCTAGGSGSLNDTVNLPAGASVTYTAACDIAVSATGPLNNTATVAAPTGVTDPNTANNSATDSNTVGAGGALSVSPATVDFMTVATGSTSSPQTVTLSNTGGGPLQVTAITAATAPFNATGGSCGTTFPFTLSNGNSCTLTYTFSPTASGPASQTITVTADTNSASFTLQGTGGQGVLAVLSATLDYGTQALNSQTQQTLTVRNIGTGPLTVTNLSAVTPPFSQIAGGTCALPPPFTLAANGECTVFYRFTPTAAGTFTQTLTITADVGAVQVTLRGIGAAAGAPAVPVPVGSVFGSLLLIGLFALTAGVLLRRRA